MAESSPRNTLVRAWSADMAVNYGNVVVAEVLRRRVTTKVPMAAALDGRATHVQVDRDFPGAVLIDTDAAIGPIAAAFARGHTYRITIADTNEYAWVPVAAYRAVGDYWTIECVPYLEHHRAMQPTDSDIIRKAHE